MGKGAILIGENHLEHGDDPDGGAPVDKESDNIYDKHGCFCNCDDPDVKNVDDLNT